MAKKRAIIVTSFGRRDIDGLLGNLKTMAPELPVKILNEQNCHAYWRGHPRWGQRNSDLHKATAAFSSGYDTVLILDDDMRIVNKSFLEGFELAEAFGVCLPMNPRKFADLDAAVGADVSPVVKTQLPKYPAGMTAVNMGTIYASCHDGRSVTLFKEYRRLMLRNPCRGPTAMWMAIWNVKIRPYILAEQWCLCAHNIKETCKHGQIVIPPIILHVGHSEVMQWYLKDALFQEIRNAELLEYKKL